VSSVLPSPDALVGDPLYTRLKEHLVESTGLTYYADKDIDFARRVGRRLSTIGVHDCASYLDILRDPVRGSAEMDELIAEITIGETYFFRHQEHFDALRDQVLPDIILRNRAKRSLRIWCAGCADGPEPYSLAILLKRQMAHQLLGWEVTILGTDINRRSLARARKGKFEEWAFRSTPDDLKRNCFAKEGRLWSIAAEYKEWVSFQYHNLVEHHFPSLINNLSAFDLIVCRNVMIYFGPDQMRRMIPRFQECLVPGGWLLVGPSEPNMTYFTSFRTVNAPGVTLYQNQKPNPSALSPGTEGFTMASLPPPPSLSRPGPPPADAPPSESADPTLADVRHHADRGAWEDAAWCCGELLEKDHLNSSVHFYHGLVLEQMRRHAEAEQSLRRAIYLDRQSALAHYYLGLFLQSRGDFHEAARSFENALDLLDPRDDADIFADADGITVVELKKLARMHLEILREPV
jgi:chemotaxis protein methyltransferase CheR